jgi:DNA-binding transcriptional MerR regulator
MNCSRLIPAIKLREEMLNISARTESRWAKAGLLPAPIKIRGRRYYDTDQLNKALAKLRLRQEAA